MQSTPALAARHARPTCGAASRRSHDRNVNRNSNRNARVPQAGD